MGCKFRSCRRAAPAHKGLCPDTFAFAPVGYPTLRNAWSVGTYQRYPGLSESLGVWDRSPEGRRCPHGFGCATVARGRNNRGPWVYALDRATVHRETNSTAEMCPWRVSPSGM